MCCHVYISLFNLSDYLADIQWFVFISKPLRFLWVLFSPTVSSLGLHHLSEWLNFCRLHNFLCRFTHPVMHAFLDSLSIYCIHLICGLLFRFFLILCLLFSWLQSFLAFIIISNIDIMALFWVVIDNNSSVFLTKLCRDQLMRNDLCLLKSP